MKFKWLLILVITLLALVPILFLISVRAGLFGELPEEEELKKLDSFTAARVLASDGDLAGLYYLEKRTQARISDIPEHLVRALISTEDARFYSHRGFDARAALRVLIKSVLLRDRSSGGGSTISQQLAKNLFPRKNFGIITLPVAKTREVLIAKRLEKVFSKDEILELYLNTVTFGENAYGIGTASLTYFSKEPANLSIEESALLVGLLKASSGYNPRLHPEAALERRNVVLDRMVQSGYLDEFLLDSLQKIPIELKFMKLDHVSGPAPYFREHIKQELMAILDEVAAETGITYNLYTDGLTIYTTLNLDVQQYAEEAMKVHFKMLQREFRKNWAGREPWRKNYSVASVQVEQSQPYQSYIDKGMDHRQAVEALKTAHNSRIFTWQGVRDTLISPLDSILHHFEMLQCGLVAVDPHTGALLAWVGGDDYEFFKYDHVTAKRQTGSTFKPLVYAAAIEQGVDPCKLYSAEAETYEEYSNWTPGNYDDNYDGFYSMQGALVNSINTVSVKVFMDCEMSRVTDLAANMGINSHLPEYPSLALGSADISLLEMTAAYAAFINEGNSIHPYAIEKITDRNGNVIYQAELLPGNEALSATTAEIMTGMLMAVADRGTASSLRTTWKLDNALAGKTGTTQDHTDAWFIGMTPSIVIGVWAGGDNPVVRFRSGSQGSGAYSALPVFARMIKKMKSDPSLKPYVQGDFNISPETYEILNCQDYSERRGLRNTARHLPDAQKTRKDPTGTGNVKNEEGEKNFFKKLFGRKKNK